MSREEQFWRDFSKSRTDENRNRLLVHYQNMVEKIAKGEMGKLRGKMRISELVSAGNDGLRQAVERFDPRRRVKFSTFARYRIRGAMMDAMRGEDIVPRLIRKDLARLASAGMRSGEGDEELSRRAGLTRERLEWTRRLPRLSFLSDIARQEKGGERSLDEALPGREDGEFAGVENREEARVWLMALPVMQRIILWFYYIDGLTMREVGEMVDLTESCVCQVVNNALGRLRDYASGKKKRVPLLSAEARGQINRVGRRRERKEFSTCEVKAIKATIEAGRGIFETSRAMKVGYGRLKKKWFELGGELGSRWKKRKLRV